MAISSIRRNEVHFWRNTSSYTRNQTTATPTHVNVMTSSLTQQHHGNWRIVRTPSDILSFLLGRITLLFTLNWRGVYTSPHHMMYVAILVTRSHDLRGASHDPMTSCGVYYKITWPHLIELLSCPEQVPLSRKWSGISWVSVALCTMGYYITTHIHYTRTSVLLDRGNGQTGSRVQSSIHWSRELPLQCSIFTSQKMSLLPASWDRGSGWLLW